MSNDLVLRNAPHIAPRNDTLCGPAGRRGDMVGAPYLMHRDDLIQVAPLWLNYTSVVRDDKEVIACVRCVLRRLCLCCACCA